MKETKTSRHVVLKGKQDIVFEDRPLPEEVGDNEILVRAVCSLISPGTELAKFNKTHIDYNRPEDQQPGWLKYPTKLGYALVGVVEQVGAGVTAYRPGDRTLSPSPHGSHAVCDIDKVPVVAIPDGVTDEQAAFARLAAISMVGAREARILLGERTAVFGLGVIGQFAAQLTAIGGSRNPLAFDLQAGRVALARRNGVNAHDLSGTTVADILAAENDGQPLDCIIDATGNVRVLDTAFDHVKDGGRIVLLGSPRDTIEVDVYKQIHSRRIQLIGAHTAAYPRFERVPGEWTFSDNIRALFDWFKDGKLAADGYISRTIRPDDLADAYRLLTEDGDDCLGVFIDWT